MQNEKFVSTNSYFSSFYIFTALHGMHLLGGLFFWGKVCSKTLKLKQNEIISQKKSISSIILILVIFIDCMVDFFLNYLCIQRYGYCLVQRSSYIKKTRITPTTAIRTNRIFTDFKYFLISGFFSPFEKNPAPKDITK